MILDYRTMPVLLEHIRDKLTSKQVAQFRKGIPKRVRPSRSPTRQGL